MTLQFKKFLALLGAGAYAVFVSWVFIKLVENEGLGFGVIYTPVFFVLALISAFPFLKRKFSLSSVSELDEKRLDGKGWAALLFIIGYSLISGIPFGSPVFDSYARDLRGLVLYVMVWILLVPILIRLLKVELMREVLFWLGLVLFLYIFLYRVGFSLLFPA